MQPCPSGEVGKQVRETERERAREGERERERERKSRESREKLMDS